MSDTAFSEKFVDGLIRMKIRDANENSKPLMRFVVNKCLITNTEYRLGTCHSAIALEVRYYVLPKQ